MAANGRRKQWIAYKIMKSVMNMRKRFRNIESEISYADSFPIDLFESSSRSLHHSSAWKELQILATQTYSIPSIVISTPISHETAEVIHGQIGSHHKITLSAG
jgi:hypothetical protein